MVTKWAKVRELVTRRKNKGLIVFTFSRPRFKMEVGNIHLPFSKTLFSSGITVKFLSPEIMKVWPQLSQSIISIGEFNML